MPVIDILSFLLGVYCPILLRAARRTVHYGFTAVLYGSRYRTVEDLRAPSDGRTQYSRRPYFTIENGHFGPSMAVK